MMDVITFSSTKAMLLGYIGSFVVVAVQLL